MGTSADKVYKVRADDVHRMLPDDTTRGTGSAYSSRQKEGKNPRQCQNKDENRAASFFFVSHCLAISYVFFFFFFLVFPLVTNFFLRCSSNTYVWRKLIRERWLKMLSGEVTQLACLIFFFFLSQSRRLDGNISRNAFLFVFTSRVTPSHQGKSVDHF